ncbi:hypothetical protein EV646_11141 [Kribbella antiqua]|uniref:Uncharacterized protein n=1 Tax=Kribbella antiqua TaxID=2512217 RepID=A0A4R2IJ34_9ACTN|nr:hypothetical protein [Kribbella antiqua]TCO43849.1 hypothetical protein EV646_11141 [Kribbella antiqua]
MPVVGLIAAVLALLLASRGDSRFRLRLLMALTIAGIAAFTLLFLGRSRYLLGDVPVLIALALTALPARKALTAQG